jgi:hypothetical protein
MSDPPNQTINHSTVSSNVNSGRSIPQAILSSRSSPSASMGKAQYQYQPLPENGTIRILTLDPGKQGDPLKGKLEAVPIDSAGSYEALSYVWAEPGPLDGAYEILVRNSNNVQALLDLRGGSIIAAMHHLRLSNQSRRIWVDQCCINQDDPVERSKQVQFMNRIYRDAAHILIWLGLDTEKQAASAFGLVRELDEILKSHSANSPSSMSSTLDLETHIRENQKVLQALTNRAWVSFERYHHKLNPARERPGT